MKLKKENEKAGLKLNIQKTKIMASGPITSWQIDGENSGNSDGLYFLGLQNHLWLLRHNIHFEITLAQGVFLGHKMIDMNLEERQVSKRRHSLINIA